VVTVIRLDDDLRSSFQFRALRALYLLTIPNRLVRFLQVIDLFHNRNLITGVEVKQWSNRRIINEV